jgi:hypothetical protein
VKKHKKFFFGGDLYMAHCDKSFNDVVKLDLSAYCLSLRVGIFRGVFISGKSINYWDRQPSNDEHFIIVDHFFFGRPTEFFLIYGMQQEITKKVERFYKSKI